MGIHPKMRVVPGWLTEQGIGASMVSGEMGGDTPLLCFMTLEQGPFLFIFQQESVAQHG